MCTVLGVRHVTPFKVSFIFSSVIRDQRSCRQDETLWWRGDEPESRPDESGPDGSRSSVGRRSLSGRSDYPNVVEKGI